MERHPSIVGSHQKVPSNMFSPTQPKRRRKTKGRPRKYHRCPIFSHIKGRVVLQDANDPYHTTPTHDPSHGTEKWNTWNHPHRSQSLVLHEHETSDSTCKTIPQESHRCARYVTRAHGWERSVLSQMQGTKGSIVWMVRRSPLIIRRMRTPRPKVRRWHVPFDWRRSVQRNGKRRI